MHTKIHLYLYRHPQTLKQRLITIIIISTCVEIFTHPGCHNQYEVSYSFYTLRKQSTESCINVNSTCYIVDIIEKFVKMHIQNTYLRDTSTGLAWVGLVQLVLCAENGLKIITSKNKVLPQGLEVSKQGSEFHIVYFNIWESRVQFSGLQLFFLFYPRSYYYITKMSESKMYCTSEITVTHKFTLKNLQLR